ncbi:MAG: divergent polysaccharide deacetylase family protein [Desulfobacterales bacterium]|nr:divergent polysaccharide deacetylase family protein [Desulfobacterales bacterium]
MAKRKTTRKKKNRKKSSRHQIFKSSLLKAFAGVACLFVLVLAAGVVAHFLIKQQKTSSPDVSSPQPPPAPPKPTAKAPPFEVYPRNEIPAPQKPQMRPKPKELPPTVKKKLPLVAIIIDDLGYDKKIAAKLGSLNANITFSILPHSPYQLSIARMSREKGIETMLHLPMEPVEYPNVDPGPGALLTSMSPDELIGQLKDNLKTLPDVKGVNNHMGSRMTTESGHLYQIFSILKKRNLYFVDSRTSAQTLCKPSARLFQIPFAQRDIFLDHRQDADFIRKQISGLIRIARHNGYAVAIGHPNFTTYQVLREMMPALQNAVELVPASKIVKPIG